MGKHRRAMAKVRVQGRREFSPGGQMQGIVQVDRVALHPVGELPLDPTAKPIWELVQDIMKDVPNEQLDRLPVDGAGNHDHYIYGTPKRAP